MNTILVTGGAGYIGSHVCKALKEEGFLPVVIDNLSHGHHAAIQWGPFLSGNILVSKDLDEAIETYRPSGIIHLAGSIHLRESFDHPEIHYENNVSGTLSVLRAMVRHKVPFLVFSSSAAIYAAEGNRPLNEESPKAPGSPYGRTKWIAEQMIADFVQAHGIRAVCLRYFNAAGADRDGTIGEAHFPETHLIPRLIEALQEGGDPFTLYADSLPTPDGTAIRDFIHVSDLATGHVAALRYLFDGKESGSFNLGTGKGSSVREVIEQVEQLGGAKIPILKKEGGAPEVPILIADPSKAKKTLSWNPVHSSLSNIIKTAYRWHTERTFEKV